LDSYKDIIKLNDTISIDVLLVPLHRKYFKQIELLIFLYEAVGISGIMSLFQLLAEKHDTNLIQYWLNELRSGGIIPHKAITNFSFVLLNVACV